MLRRLHHQQCIGADHTVIWQPHALAIHLLVPEARYPSGYVQLAIRASWQAHEHLALKGVRREVLNNRQWQSSDLCRANRGGVSRGFARGRADCVVAR